MGYLWGSIASRTPAQGSGQVYVDVYLKASGRLTMVQLVFSKTAEDMSNNVLSHITGLKRPELQLQKCHVQKIPPYGTPAMINMSLFCYSRAPKNECLSTLIPCVCPHPKKALQIVLQQNRGPCTTEGSNWHRYVYVMSMSFWVFFFSSISFSTFPKLQTF